jgi:hypothetical protein
MVALYFCRGDDNDDILAIAAAHAICPPPMHHKDATTDIMSGISTLHKINDLSQSKICRLGRHQAKGGGDVEAVAASLLEAKQGVEKMNIRHLDCTAQSAANRPITTATCNATPT